MPSRGGYAIVSASYWAFTLSDGALRMLVLLHLHAQGQTAWGLALLLVPYEIAGVFTNLLGGWLSARFGQKPVLLSGLLLQVTACLMLTVPTVMLTLPYVMATQVLSGVAKDFAKTTAKSYVRTLAPDAEAGRLFWAVAVLTGSKNAIKGLGFFVGGALLTTVGFAHTNLGLAIFLAILSLGAAGLLPRTPGKPSAGLQSLFSHNSAVNWLAAARLFLFGSRDAWFAVALPVFLVTTWNWDPTWVGGFLAVWIIGYGSVQTLAPKIVRTRSVPGGMRRTVSYTLLLLVPLALSWTALQYEQPSTWVLAGLLLYGVVFACCSSLHSWLVIAIADADSVAERVGFYYAANAAGRLLGVLASGYLFEAFDSGAAGLAATVLASGVAVLLAATSLYPATRRAEPSPS